MNHRGPHAAAQLLIAAGDNPSGCNLTLTVISTQFTTTPTNISRIERGLTHDTQLARKIRDWLLTTT